MTLIGISALTIFHKDLLTVTRRVGNRKNQENKKNSNPLLCQNTENDPEDSRKIAVTQTPVEDNQFMLL